MKPQWKESNSIFYLSDDNWLANDQWVRYGSCSGLQQLDYFETAVQLSNKLPTPDIIINDNGSQTWKVVWKNIC